MANPLDAVVCSPPAFLRSGSVYEPLKSIHLPKPDNETLWDKLDHYYRIVKSTLLLYQSPTTGLFLTKTCGVNQKARIQDSLYCAAGAWALALAYRSLEDDKGRTHELEHSTVKCVSGILYCYLCQAKQDPCPTTCLHSFFNVHTGDELLSYEEFGHLQINAESLYLLYLVEMISLGLQIIYNTDEVTFIQNLVFVWKEFTVYLTLVSGEEEADTIMAAQSYIPDCLNSYSQLLFHLDGDYFLVNPWQDEDTCNTPNPLNVTATQHTVDSQC